MINKKFILLLGFATTIFLSSISHVEAASLGGPIYGNGSPPAGYNYVPPSGTGSECNTEVNCVYPTCFNDNSVGSTSCGDACTGGQTWSRYDYQACVYQVDFGGGILCYPFMDLTSTSCSTGDKCVLADGPYLRAGFCDCSMGGVYKVCCASGGGYAGTCDQFSIDTTNPPYEGQCPAGSDDLNGHFCGWGGYPACDAVCTPCDPWGGNYRTYCSGNNLRESYDDGACGTQDNLVQNCPSGCTTTGPNSAVCNGVPTPTPTTPPASTCTGAGKTCGTDSSPVTGSSCTTSGGAAGTWQWDGQPASTSCFTNPNVYCYNCVAAVPTSPPPSDPFCPNIDTDGRPNACVNAGSCPIGYSRKAVGDNACTTNVALDPLCPVNDLDGRTNACRNSCIGTEIAKGGAADAACQGAGLGTLCCHNYAPKWCCHQNPPPTATPPPPPPIILCPNGACSGGETCSTCPADCGVCPTATPTPVPFFCGDGVCNGGETAATCDDCKVTIQGRLMRDVNRNDVLDGADTPYAGRLILLSGTSVGSMNSTSGSPYNFSFSNRTATNDLYTLDFSMPADYELVVSASSSKPRSNFLISSGADADLTNTVWLIQEINQCADGINNDGDAATDCSDSACHSDGNPANPPTCCSTPPCQEDPPGGTECSDSIDNDGDGFIDGGDNGCHTDGDATDGDNTWDPNDDNEIDLPNCTTQSVSPNPVDAGGQTTLTVGNCINTTPTVTPTTTPPFEWTPTPQDPPGDGHECSDASDNDSDSQIDSQDPGCHEDGNPNNPGSYDPNDDDEGNGGGGSPECSDGSDNDSDSFTDINDPGCHTDGNPSNPGSYDPTDDHESSVPYPECSDGRDNADPDALVDHLDPECHTDGDTSNPDTYNPDDPSESAPANSCSDAAISNPTNNAGYTSGTATWTAPSCPGNGGLTCPVTMTVNGQGGSTDISLGNVTVNPTFNVTVQVHEDTNYNDCTSGSTPYGGNVQVGLVRTLPVPQQTATRTMSGGSETFSCQLPGSYEISIATPNGYRGVGATLVNGGPQSAGSQVSTNQYNLTLGTSNPTIRFCVTTLAPWIQTDSGDVRFNIIDNPVPSGQSASRNTANPSLLFSSVGNGSIGLGSVSPDGDKEWIIDDEYSYNRNMKSVNGAAAYTFYKSRIKQRNITLNTINSGAQGAIAPATTGVYEITGNADGDFDLTGYTHPTVSGTPGRVVLLVPGNLTISSEIDVPVGGLLIVAVQGSITIAESVGDDPANYSSTDAHLNGIFTAEQDINIPGNLCADGATQDRKLNIAGSLVANARKPFADDPINGGRIDNQRSLCQDDADYASVNVATRADFLLQLTDFYKTTYTRWKEVRP